MAVRRPILPVPEPYQWRGTLCYAVIAGGALGNVLALPCKIAERPQPAGPGRRVNQKRGVDIPIRNTLPGKTGELEIPLEIPDRRPIVGGVQSGGCEAGRSDLTASDRSPVRSDADRGISGGCFQILLFLFLFLFLSTFLVNSPAGSQI